MTHLAGFGTDFKRRGLYYFGEARRFAAEAVALWAWCGGARARGKASEAPWRSGG